MTRCLKASLCLIMAITMILSTSISFGAESKNKEIELINDTMRMTNNNVFFYAYNLPVDYEFGAMFEDTSLNHVISVSGKECINNPLLIKTTPGGNYEFSTVFRALESGTQDYNYDNAGGLYKKMRVKLSRYNYFNDDGSHSSNTHTFHFGKAEVDGNRTYYGGLIIVSGSAVNFVCPDDNGYVEFYASTNIEIPTRFYTNLRCVTYTEAYVSIGSDSGRNGDYMLDFTKGIIDTNLSIVTIKDATKIQRYLSKNLEFDEMQEYRADVDNDYRISIMDVTKIQRYLVQEVKK